MIVTKRSHILKQTCTFQVKVQLCLSMPGLFITTRHFKGQINFLHSEQFKLGLNVILFIDLLVIYIVDFMKYWNISFHSKILINCIILVYIYLVVQGDTSCSPQDEKRDGVSFITIASVGMGKSYAITALGRWD